MPSGFDSSRRIGWVELPDGNGRAPQRDGGDHHDVAANPLWRALIPNSVRREINSVHIFDPDVAVTRRLPGRDRVELVEVDLEVLIIDHEVGVGRRFAYCREVAIPVVLSAGPNPIHRILYRVSLVVTRRRGDESDRHTLHAQISYGRSRGAIEPGSGIPDPVRLRGRPGRRHTAVAQVQAWLLAMDIRLKPRVARNSMTDASTACGAPEFPGRRARVRRGSPRVTTYASGTPQASSSDLTAISKLANATSAAWRMGFREPKGFSQYTLGSSLISALSGDHQSDLRFGRCNLTARSERCTERDEAKLPLPTPLEHLISAQAFGKSFHSLRERLESSLVASARAGAIALELGGERVELLRNSPTVFGLAGQDLIGAVELDRQCIGSLRWDRPAPPELVEIGARHYRLGRPVDASLLLHVDDVWGDQRRGVDLVLRQIFARRKLQHVEAAGDFRSVDEAVVPVGLTNGPP